MDERRRNTRGRIRYELKQSAIATLSVAISWGILFLVNNYSNDANNMNYEFLFRMLISLLILVTIISYIIGLLLEKYKRDKRAR